MTAILTLNLCVGVILSRSFVYKPLFAAVALTFAHSVQAASDTWSSSRLCHAPAPSSAELARAKTSGGDALPSDVTRITADKAAGQTNVVHRAEGDAIVERNGDTLNAQWVEYNPQDETVQAGDAFVLTRQNGEIVQGERLNYHLAQKNGSADNAEFVAEQDGRRLQGVSKKVTLLNEQQTQLQDVKFNTCSAGDTSWYIQAAEMKADNKSGIGVARHARLVFAGVPILYTPWVDFPINGNRKSGFLVPTVSIGSDGATYKQPYYFNLAPNYDATVTPAYISERGAQLGGEFRYLQPKYRGAISAEYMPHDSESEYDNRYEVRLKHYHQFNAHLSGGIDFTQVSDNDYYRDFYGRNEIAENVNLDRQLWLSYVNQWLGGNVQAGLLVRKYQTLPDGSGNISRPYAILPRFSLDWQRSIGNASLNWTSHITHFEHPDWQSGSRLVVYPSVTWDFSRSWGYVRPKIGVHATQYWLKNEGGNPSRRVSRVLPIANVDAGLTFEREQMLFKQAYIQTLEPRLFYNYIPSREQNTLPNFDSSQNSFSYDQLFRENIFSGSDRINASNSTAVGIQTRLLNANTGAEVFRAGVGQKYYFSDDDVLLDGSLQSSARRKSDIAAFAGGQIYPNWFADTQLHWNESTNRTEQMNFGLRYNPEAGKVLSSRFKYSRNEEIFSGYFGELRHVDLAAQWPITPNLYAVGRYNFSVKPYATLEQTLGLEYKNPCGCWSMSVVGQRYATGIENGRTTHKNAVFFTLQLKDLSNIGNNPYEQLRLGIPGYSKTNEVYIR